MTERRVENINIPQADIEKIIYSSAEAKELTLGEREK